MEQSSTTEQQNVSNPTASNMPVAPLTMKELQKLKFKERLATKRVAKIALKQCNTQRPSTSSGMATTIKRSVNEEAAQTRPQSSPAASTEIDGWQTRLKDLEVALLIFLKNMFLTVY